MKMREHYDQMDSKASTMIRAPLREGISLKIDNTFLNVLPSFHSLSTEVPYSYFEELTEKVVR